MTSIGRVAVALCISAIPVICSAAADRNDTDWQSRMLSEISELRADLTAYLADVQQRRIISLTRELRQVRQEQKQLHDAEQQQAAQLEQIERLLTSQEADSSVRSQVEAWKVQLVGEGAAKLRSELAGLADRETDIVRRLEREQQKDQALQERIRHLRMAPSRP